MYTVELINDDGKYIIHSPTIQLGADKVIGQIKQGINVIDSFSFTIYPNNKGYPHLKQMKSVVKVWRGNKLEFCGRVLLIVPKMSNNGLIQASVTCESDLGYLMDSVTDYQELENVTINEFISLLITTHNQQVDSFKRFEIGNIEATERISAIVDYVKTFEAIKSNLLDSYNYEIRIRYDGETRYFDYVRRIGEDTTTDIALAKNLITLEQERDPGELVTRLIPLGAKLEESEERLTIAAVNGGKLYLDDEAGIGAFGIVAGSVAFDDVTDAGALKARGEAYLAGSRVIKKHKIEAVDLSLIGLDFNSFEVGNGYPVNNPLMGIDEVLRVVEKTIDINAPQSSSLVIGDKFEDIKDYQLSAINAEKTLSVVNTKVNATLNAVNIVNQDLKDTVLTLNETIGAVGNNTASVDGIVLTLNAVIEQVNGNTTSIGTLVDSINAVIVNVNEHEKTLSRLIKRASMEV